MSLIKNSVFLIVVCSFFAGISAQDKFKFESVADVKDSPVKSQGQSGTCWVYSTISFVESEIMRMGGPELNLSEMYIVKHAYLSKAKQYVLLHGKGNFSEGGQAHDVMNEIAKHGFVPEADYLGTSDTSKAHDHTEMAMTMTGMLDCYIDRDGAMPVDMWFTNINSVLTNYLGELPTETVFNKRVYSPAEFANGLGVDASNYIELTSYTHHPFYKPFDLEVPDNWSHDRYINLPIDELMEVMKTALKSGFTFVWDGDVSDDFFSRKEGVALLPVDTVKGFVPQEELQVLQEDRQKAFFSWKATDDHLMHIVGLAKDKNGTIYFKTKNSWGEKSNSYGGYWYMSEAYVRMNTVAIMLHKQALSEEVNAKIM